MPGFDQATSHSPEQESEQSARRRTRYGQILFLLYLILYSGFVLLSAFAPSTMERTPFAGVNLAVLYGLALIAVAFLFALFYDWLCRLLQVKWPHDKESGR